jgi:hypothetical protein
VTVASIDKNSFESKSANRLANHFLADNLMSATTLTILVRMHSLHKEPVRITRASMIAIARFYIVYLQMPVWN